VKQWDSKAEKLGEELAKAIVAYRELRAFTNAAGAVQTGDYKYSGGVNYVSRGWNEKDAGGDYVPPTSRRGTGFLTVGELANVRHTGAAIPVPGLTPNGFARYSPFRMDGGVVGNTTQQEDYVSAVSLLVALSDWASVRSDVYTVYGSIWGEPFDDPKAVQKLEARALRCQETVDRLPTFLGQSAPAGIGEPVMLRYNDMNAD